MTTLIAAVSDVHAGSTVAVCPPTIELDDGGFYQASRAQQWLWQGWLGYWEWIEGLRDAHAASLYTVFNGDLVDGNHHGTTQILTGNPTAQAAVWDELVKVPNRLAPDKMFIVRGTETHVGPSASSEERIALGLLRDGRPIQKDPDTDRASWWHLRMEIEGRRLSFAHHGRAGQRPWTEQNAVTLLAKEIFLRHCEDDAWEERQAMTFPHLVVRSHFHRHWDSGPKACPTRVIQLPAWQLATGYVHKKHPETRADIGGCAFLVRDGEIIQVFDRIDKAPRSTVWAA